MRGVDVMGFQECGVGETLTYRPRVCSEQMASEGRNSTSASKGAICKNYAWEPLKDKSKANCLCHAG